MPYACKQIAIEDRETLCKGLCSVIASLPPERWSQSLDALAQPILSCLTILTKEADQLYTTTYVDINGETKDRIDPILIRLSNEIRLLAAIVRFFMQADLSRNHSEVNGEKAVSQRNAVVALLRKSWPCLTHIGETYTSHEVSWVMNLSPFYR